MILVAQKNTNENNEQMPSTKFATIQKELKDKSMLYDVRTAEEYRASHFENATNWSLQELEDGKLPDVSKDTKIYVYCRSGNRSSRAASILKKAGYVNVTDLGGLSDVQSMGGKLI